MDDSRSVRKIIKKAFKDYDVTNHEAENGEEGLELIGSIWPDLVILD